MILNDYMSAEKFPMASRSDYSPDTQLQMDAFDLDAMELRIAEGHKLNDKQAAVFQELKTRGPHIGPLARLVTQQQQASQQPVTSAATSLDLSQEGVIDLMRRNQASFQEECEERQSYKPLQEPQHHLILIRPCAGLRSMSQHFVTDTVL